jgi:predicted nuclease of predicted toxin-antitoxin system
MNFLVGAQLPKRLANWLNEAGQNALRTLDLPRKNLSTDSEIINRARQDGRVVVTKDDDFVRSFLSTGKPLLLLICMGNMNNNAFEKILRASLAGIEAAFATSRVGEITADVLVVHE